MSQTLIRPRRRPSFLDKSPAIDGVIELVSIISNESIYWSQLYMKSRIKFKNSFVKYVNYCIEKGFFEIYYVPLKGHGSRFERNKTKHRYYKYYKITDNGRKFLESIE